MYFYQLHIINANNPRTIVNCFGQATLTCYQFPSTFFHFIWFTYLKKNKKLTWYIHEQIPVPELHNVLSQSTRVCKFLGVKTVLQIALRIVTVYLTWVTIYPFVCCVTHQVLYTHLYTHGSPSPLPGFCNVWPGKWAGYNNEK